MAKVKLYNAKKVNSPMTVYDDRWKQAEQVLLDYVWEDNHPSPFKTTARAVHSPKGITVKLSTDEWPIKATKTTLNAHVCSDSCMEFFFAPSEKAERYVNIEVNPLGISLTAIGKNRHDRRRLDITKDEFVIETLIRPFKGWDAMIFVPYTFIDRHYFNRDKKMRANFYKCGDKTECEHYSTWNNVETEKPDFHRMEFFGDLVLTDDKII